MNSLSGKKILVTGSTGFVGSHVINGLPKSLVIALPIEPVPPVIKTFFPFNNIPVTGYTWGLNLNYERMHCD